MRTAILLLYFLLSNIILLSQPVSSSDTKEVLKNSKSDFFIENKGQWLPQVRYLARMNGLNAWVTDSGVVYDYFKIEQPKDIPPFSKGGRGVLNDTSRRIKGHVIRMSFLNCLPPDKSKPKSERSLLAPVSEEDKKAVYDGINKQEGYYNYFIGNDSTKWASNVPLFKEVKVKNVYNGIDVRYYYEGNNIRYDYIVQPGADISQIKVKYRGHDSLYVNAQGELIFKTSLGDIKHAQLKGYQDNEHLQPLIKLDDKDTLASNIKIYKGEDKLDCKFYINPDGTVGFKVENYNPALPLIIDPLILFYFRDEK
jgi:hypothetical protein